MICGNEATFPKVGFFRIEQIDPAGDENLVSGLAGAAFGGDLFPAEVWLPFGDAEGIGERLAAKINEFRGRDRGSQNDD